MGRPKLSRQPNTEAYQRLVQRYVYYREAHGYKQRGAYRDGQRVGEFLAWLESRSILDIESITTQNISKYWSYVRMRPKHDGNGGTLSTSTVNSHISAIRGVLAMLHHAGELVEDPASGLSNDQKEKRESEVRPALSQSEIKALYACSESQLERAVLGLGYGCGLRVSEAVSLNVGAIRLAGGNRLSSGSIIVELGKGGRRRIVPLSGGVRDDLADFYYGERIALEELKGDRQDALILNSRGDRMQAWTYNRVLGQMVGRAIKEGRLSTEVLQKRTSFHGLRHAIATHLLEQGLSLEQVRQFLGHQHLETTEIYTHVSRSMLDKLVKR